MKTLAYVRDMISRLINLTCTARGFSMRLEDLAGFIIGGHGLNNMSYTVNTVLMADSEGKNYLIR